jgi:2-dehydropantoate 2-reductase
LKVCVYGAGGVGGNVAVSLIRAEAAEVSVVARGAHLAAIRARGITLRSDGRDVTARPLAATDDASTLPKQDIVLVGLKAHSLPGEATKIAGLLAPDGAAVFMNNGFPWWWNHGLRGREGALPLLDPDGSLWREVRPERALGCLVMSSNDVVEPGVVLHNGSNRWTFGEPAGGASERVERIVALFRRAGLNGEATNDVRRGVWQKLVLNVSANPLQALTRSRSKDIMTDAGMARVARDLIAETLALAAAMGWDLRGEIDPEQMADPARRRLDVRSSMLQDALAGRRMEADAILGQTQRFAREHGVPTPTIDIVYALLAALDRSFAQPTPK